MTTYLEIEFTCTSASDQEILIALLTDRGFTGFEETHTSLKAFIPKNDFKKEYIETLPAALTAAFSIREIEPVNWNRYWESGYHPVIMDDFVSIRAAFHPPTQQVQHDILIHPKMSFGTGHHETTRLMIKLMRETDFGEKSVLDFGTGTGILAILAEKMGAGKILAMDNDPLCIENAAENIGLNHCTRIRLLQSSALPAGEKFNIILVNITKNVIAEILPETIYALFHPGQILLSGFLENDEEEISRMAKKFSLQPRRRLIEKNWVSLRYEY